MMTREPLPAFHGFIETGFEQRFQGLLRQARQQRSWHVIVAEPGSGKTMGIRDLVETTARGRGSIGGRSFPILAVTAPKNDPKEQALGNYLLLAMDFPTRGRWSERKYSMIYLLRQYGVECVVIDDAHDLSLQHLILLKELTDQLRLPPYDHALGLCLVTAGRGATMPLKDVLDRPETMWMQFRRRLDAVQPYCKIAGHTQEEVRAILLALERIYQAVFPALNLRKWTGAIYTWLTHPLLDPDHSGRVTMDHLMKLVTTALQWTYAAGERDVTTQTLEAVAELLTLHRDTIRVLDAPQAQDAQRASPEETPEERSARHPKERRRAKASQPRLRSNLPPPGSG
jgi:Bacterial TniB protein